MSRTAALALLAVVAASLLWWLFLAPNRTDLATYFALVVAVVTLLAMFVPRSSRRNKTGSVLELLAKDAREQWEWAAGDRRLTNPPPIDVRWGLDESLSGDIATVLRSTALLAMPGCGPIDLNRLRGGGGLDDLHLLCGALRRLVITGPPGSGKTAAGVVLVTGALRMRATLPDAERAQAPVPVMFTPSGWDPRTQSVADWLVAQLCRSYESVFPGRRGISDARELLGSGRITVVLDGFDEIAPELRKDALDALNRESRLRLVLLSRREELGGVAAQALLHGAVAVALRAVEAKDAADYLAGIRSVNHSPAWASLIARLRYNPDDPLANTLRSPLMITLVRDACAENTDMQELLRRPAGQVESFLWGKLVESVYRRYPGRPQPRWRADTARHTLRWIAERMNRDQTRDLAWWRLPTWTPVLPSAMVVGAAGGLAFLGMTWLMLGVDPRGLGLWAILFGLGVVFGTWTVGAEAVRPARWATVVRHPLIVFAYGLVLGLPTAFGFGLRGWVTVPTEVAMIAIGACLIGYRRIRPPRKATVAGPFLVGLGAGLAAITAAVETGLASAMKMFLAFSLVWFLALLRLAFRVRVAVSPDAQRPLDSWRRWRWSSLAGWLLLTVPCVLAPFYLGATVDVLVRPELGDISSQGFITLSGGLLGLVVPESWLASIACVQLAARHRLPVRLLPMLDDARSRGVLRAVGPGYQFRHAHLQDLLARSASARPARYGLDKEMRALRWIADRTSSEADRTIAWWRVSCWTASKPRLAVTGAGAALAVLSGMAVFDRFLLDTRSFAIAVGALAGLGGVLGAAVKEWAPGIWAAGPARFRSRRALFAIGLGCGFTAGFDLIAVVGLEVTTGVANGMAAAVLCWAAIGLGLALLGQTEATMSGRWRHLSRAVPRAFWFVQGVGLGNLAFLFQYWGWGPYPELLIDLFGAAVVTALGICLLSRQVGDAAPLPSVGGRVAHLAAWLVGGGLASGYLMRSAFGLGLVLSHGPLGPGQPFTSLLDAALPCGLLLGLLFPADVTASMACLQLAIRHRLPLRLFRLLDDACARGTLCRDGARYRFPG